MSKRQLIILSGLVLTVTIVCIIALTVAYTMVDEVYVTFPDASKVPAATEISTATPAPTTTPDDAPKIEFLDDRSYDSGNYMITEGQVRNVSDQTLAFIKIVVEFYDDGDHFVTSDWDYAEFTTLEPGQTSPFKIMTPYEPDTMTYELSASYMAVPVD